MKCQHRGCNCEDASVQRAGKTFCSERCAEIETTGRHQAHCPCGHSDCRAA